MKYTMKLWDKQGESDRPFLHSRFEAIAYDADDTVVAVLHTNEIALVNQMGNTLARSSGQPVRMLQYAYNVVSREYYEVTEGRGRTYTPAPIEEEVL